MYIDHELAIADMIRYHEAGFTSWDLADIYGPSEDFIGEFRRPLLTLVIDTKRKRRRTWKNSGIHKMDPTTKKNYMFYS